MRPSADTICHSTTHSVFEFNHIHTIYRFFCGKAMFVDSLVNLSSKAVAKCLVEDRYRNLDFSLLPSLSDQVFYEVLNISSSNYPRVIAKETGLKLNLTRFNSIISPVDREDLAMLQLHDIQRLILDLGGFEDEFTVKTEEGTILDIIGILKTILNEESRKNLRKLIIEDYGGNFERKWVQKLAELLPNLQVLDFEVPSIDVTAVCRRFPNLMHLTCHEKCSLREIHLLKSLRTLSMDYCMFKPSADIKGLFDLPSLLVLDVSHSKGFFGNLLLLDGSFQNLKILECYGSDITEHHLRQLVGRNPSLETIGCFGTSCERVDFADLPATVLNLATFRSTMRTLRYAIYRRNGIYVEEVGGSIDRLAELLETKRVGDGLKEDEFLKLMMETTRKCPWRREGKNQVTKCLVPYFKRCFPDQSITEILQNLDPEASLFIERRWAAQLVLKNFPEPECAS